MQSLKKLTEQLKKYGNASAAYKLNATILLGTGWTRQQVSEALCPFVSALNPGNASAMNSPESAIPGMEGLL